MKNQTEVIGPAAYMNAKELVSRLAAKLPFKAIDDGNVPALCLIMAGVFGY